MLPRLRPLPSLLRLPNELIWEIAKFSTRPNRAALTRTSKTVNAIVRPVLYKLTDTEVLEVFVRSGDKQWEETMVVLLDRILRMNKQDPRMGYQALTAASQCGSLRVVQALLDAGIKLGPSRNLDDDDDSTDDSIDDEDIEEWNIGGLPVDNVCDTPLIAAADEGHIGVVRLLLQYGANPNFTSMVTSPMEAAAGNNQVDVMRVLLAAGASAHALGLPSPLVAAAREGHIEATQLLLSAGVHPDREGQSTSPIIQAARFGQTDIIGMLLAAGANPGIAKGNGMNHTTALIEATKKGHLCAMETLIWAGANVCGASHSSSPLREAIITGDLPSMMILLRPGETNRRQLSPFGEEYILHMAASLGNAETIAFLLAQGLHVNSQDPTNTTPISRAAAVGNVGVVRVLLAHGAGVHLANTAGYTPLMHAACCGNVETIRLLLDAGAEPKVTTQEAICHTPLLKALVCGHGEAARVLLEHGADPCVSDAQHRTALSHAAGSTDEGTVRALLAAGADVNVVDDMGWNPIDYAVIRPHVGIVAALIGPGQGFRSLTDVYFPLALRVAIGNGDERSVADLVLRNTPLNQPDQMGRTALMFAVIQGRAAIVELLVGSGADLNHTTSTGETALMYACKWGWIGIAWILVAAGCDVDMRDDEGKAALDHFNPESPPPADLVDLITAARTVAS
ncbi:ankyrin repeat domain-containing protein [Aspergillus puulaauensis]|uniref:Ankyrin repeat-containing domain protein n=1 Tax=Aspergillus puulaauensis TaxID=1220207 RepID=A0A7R8AHC1_9EURO|nr:uncharacterized protein APUU_10253S [Aspergillus puulaauensis]BCS17425.1 hypothetical protein APUU_10253S [Aspergillus puulaauensis]